MFATLKHNALKCLWLMPFTVAQDVTIICCRPAGSSRAVLPLPICYCQDYKIRFTDPGMGTLAITHCPQYKIAHYRVVSHFPPSPTERLAYTCVPRTWRGLQDSHSSTLHRMPAKICPQGCI